jgi:hypothetical protein
MTFRLRRPESSDIWMPDQVRHDNIIRRQLIRRLIEEVSKLLEAYSQVIWNSDS